MRRRRHSLYNPSEVTITPRSARTACGALLVLLWAGTAPASAQGIPDQPLVLGDGRLTVGADVALTVSCANADDGDNCGSDTGFFNYTDYDHSTLREIRVNVNAALRAGRRVSLLADIHTENGSRPEPYALYLRVHPWEKPFDIQIGRVPPTFGAFARRGYANDNLLIGYPLAYQYLTSLRPDAIPANNDELLKMRGRGWLSTFSIGDLAADRGLPIATAFKWDTGVQVHTETPWLDAAGSVTTGSLGNPLVRDDNAGKQFAGRVALRPVMGLLVGTSVARGPFLTRDATRAAAVDVPNSQFVQSAYGVDAEYSRDYYLVRVESLFSRWTLPTLDEPLDAIATSIEGRYKLRPDFYVAARADHLAFSDVTGTTRTDAWEAPVTRYEFGAGYRLRRNLQLKASFQHNARDGGRVHRVKVGALQLVFWL
jgi:hypothetical protein